MIVAPHILGDLERQPLGANATLGRQPTLEVAPEAFEAVDVNAVTTAKLALVMVHQPVDIPLRGDARLEAQGIGTDDRAAPNVAPNQGEQRLDGQIGHDLRPDLAPPTQDPKHRGLAGPAPGFAALPAPWGAPIAPATADISFVDLDCPLEEGGTAACITSRRRVRARKTRCRCSPVSSAIAAALRPRTWHRNTASH